VELLRTDSIKWGEHPMENMITPSVFLGTFYRKEIGRFFHHANRLFAALGVTANSTQLSFSETKTFLAKRRFGFDCPDGFGQTFDILPFSA
jgi:hypothetical protein